jgi:hypothetical protein
MRLGVLIFVCSIMSLVAIFITIFMNTAPWFAITYALVVASVLLTKLHRFLINKLTK